MAGTALGSPLEYRAEATCDTTSPPAGPPPKAGGKPSKVQWLPALWVGPWGLEPCWVLHFPQEHALRGAWTRARAITHLPGSPQLESRERVQKAACPLEGGEEQALEADSRAEKRWQAEARKP